MESVINLLKMDDHMFGIAQCISTCVCSISTATVLWRKVKRNEVERAWVGILLFLTGWLLKGLIGTDS